MQNLYNLSLKMSSLQSQTICHIKSQKKKKRLIFKGKTINTCQPQDNTDIGIIRQ